MAGIGRSEKKKLPLRRRILHKRGDIEMIKILPDRQIYEAQLAKAALVINGFLARFPEPECQEQADIVMLAVTWLQETNEMLDDKNEDIGQN